MQEKLIKEVEVDIINQLEDYEKVIVENRGKKAHWVKELEALRVFHEEELSSDFYKIVLEEVDSCDEKKNIIKKKDKSSTDVDDENDDSDDSDDEYHYFN